MSLHKHAPYPKNRMWNKNPVNTICEELREAYRCVDKEDTEALKIHIRVVITMAKKMSIKLKEYNENWSKDFWERKK